VSLPARCGSGGVAQSRFI